MTSVSKRIEEQRIQKGISIPALAGALGLPRTSIEKIESGRLTPSQAQLKAIADYFKVSVEYLKGITSDPGTTESWLNGDIPEEEITPVEREVGRRAAANAGKDPNDNVPFSALLKSETFCKMVHDTVIEVLNSKEGQQIIARAVKKELDFRNCIR